MEEEERYVKDLKNDCDFFVGTIQEITSLQIGKLEYLHCENVVDIDKSPSPYRSYLIPYAKLIFKEYCIVKIS